jgi:hypothetical protein
LQIQPVPASQYHSTPFLSMSMVGVVAYYTFQSMVLNTARTPVPPGAAALKPFPK